MKVTLQDGILSIDSADLPHYKKGGPIVRNSYFWALKSIACYAKRDCDWEYDQVVWEALCRLLLAFADSGYLGYSETILEFPQHCQIPESLRSVSVWQ